MITVNLKRINNGWLADVRCKSTDTKPVEIEVSRGYDEPATIATPNGSSCIEIDTGNIYFFDGDSSTWVFQCSLQG